MWSNKSKVIPRNLINTMKKSKSTYQFIQNSKIPTMHFQKSLPRLPIPKLEKTCERYLAAQKPILNLTEFAKTEQFVTKFRDISGKNLQQILIKKDKKNKHTSYISELWFHKYLSDRTPLPINYNPMLVMQNDSRIEYCEQAIRTTNLLISSLRFYKSLQANILEPEVFHMDPKKSDTKTFRNICARTPERYSWYAAYLHNAYPLDMSQYYSLFNTTRIPEMDIDRIFSKPARHVLVQYKGNFYTFDVLNESGDIIEPEALYGGIQNILGKTEEAQFPIGILTTLNRDKWAALRHDLVEDGNRKSFEMIDSALFNICLDDDVIGDNKYDLIRSFLHGTGANRWFDKSLSLQLSKDGYAGVNFEHSPGDGVAVLRYFQDIHKDSIDHPHIHPDTKAAGNISVQKLDFNISDSIKTAVKDSLLEYKSICESLDINFVESEGLGKKFCKQHSVSPDAMMQLGFQRAYNQQYNKFVPTYESCSTAAFKHGRTETIRPCTTATKAYCMALNSTNKPSSTELAKLIKDCSNMHGKLTKEAAMGQGFDRHLFVLKHFANEMNQHEDIFEDPAYANINHNVLSTSTLSSPVVLAGGFGPVVNNGFGIGYVIRDKSMGTLVTSYPEMDGKGFIDCLKESMKEIVQSLTQASIKAEGSISAKQ